MELQYFDGAGRGEAIRIALAASGVEWKDTRISFSDYGAGKAAGKFALGLPLFKVSAEGPEFTQSLSILRFAGRQGNTNLYPADAAQALAVDEILDVCQDMLTKCPQNKDADEKKAARAEYMSGRCKAYFDLLNTRLGDRQFLTGDSLTVADLHFVFAIYDGIANGSWDYVPGEYVKSWPKLAELRERVTGHDVVKSYNNIKGK